MKRALSISFLLLFLYSCQNAGRENKDYGRSLNDSVSASGLTGDSVKLVKTAGIRFKVANVEQSLKAVSALAQQKGGRIYDQSFQSVEGDRKELKVSDDSLLVISTVSPQAELAVRVPSQNLEAFLFGLADLGYYTASSNVNIDDRSLWYLQNALKQEGREEVLAKPSSPKSTVAGNRQAIELYDQGVDQFIANKTIDADARYSTVTLSLFQNTVVRKETIANYVLTGYDVSFGQRLKNALSNGWEAFLSLLLALSHLWMFLLIGLFAFSFYKYYQARKKLVG